MSQHCSVPCCSNSKHKSPHLSFHDFPVDKTLRAKWVRAIKRDEGPGFVITRGSTHVCNEHFNPEDRHRSSKTSGRTRIKQGAVPSRFHWNDWGSRAREPVHQRVRKRLYAAVLDDSVEMSVPEDSTDDRGGQGGTVQIQRSVDHSEDRGESSGQRTEDNGQGTVQTRRCTARAVAKDHDYDCRPSPGKLEMISGRIRELELKVSSLEMELEQMRVDG